MCEILLSVSSSTALNLAPNCCKSSFTLTQYGQNVLLQFQKTTNQITQNHKRLLWYTKASRYMIHLWMLNHINFHEIFHLNTHNHTIVRSNDTDSKIHKETNIQKQRESRKKRLRIEKRRGPENND